MISIIVIIFSFLVMYPLNSIEAIFYQAVPCMLDDHCTQVLDASDVFAGTKCTNGYCVCQNPQSNEYGRCNNYDHYIKNSKKDVFNIPCPSKECSAIANAHCPKRNETVKMCECKSGFIKIASREPECQKIAYMVGQSCQSNIQCRYGIGPAAKCADVGEGKICLCSIGYFAVHGNSRTSRCMPQVLNKNCQNNADMCLTVGAKCNGTVCECLTDSIIDSRGETCLVIPQKVGDSCSEDRQCEKGLSEGGVCNDGRCVCDFDYHPSPATGLCVQDLEYNDPCDPNKDRCFQKKAPEGLNLLVCSPTSVGNRCGCRTPWVYSSDLKGCELQTIEESVAVRSSQYPMENCCPVHPWVCYPTFPYEGFRQP